MERKYFTNKTRLLICVAILAYVVFIPVFLVVLCRMNPEMKGIYIPVFAIVELMAIGIDIFWGKALSYPVVKDDRLILCNPVFASQSKEIMYSSVNYMKIDVTGECLSANIFLKDGDCMNVMLMTAGTQAGELLAELKSKGVSDVPVQADSLPKGSEKMYRNKIMTLAIIFALVLLAVVFAMICVMSDLDLRSMDAESISIAAGLVLLDGGLAVFLMMIANYVVLEQNRLVVKNLFFPFRDRVIFFSDIENAHLDELPRLVVTFKENPQDAGKTCFKRILTLVSHQEREEINRRLDLLK